MEAIKLEGTQRRVALITQPPKLWITTYSAFAVHIHTHTHTHIHNQIHTYTSDRPAYIQILLYGYNGTH